MNNKYKNIYINIIKYKWLYIDAVIIILGILSILYRVLYFDPNQIIDTQIYIESNIEPTDMYLDYIQPGLRLTSEILMRLTINCVFGLILEWLFRLIFGI